MLTEQFGRRLKYWREKRGLTQGAISKALYGYGNAGTNIGRYERGDLSPSLYTVERILKALDVSIVEFFEEEPS